MVEQRFCKPQVVGSNPSASFPTPGRGAYNAARSEEVGERFTGRWQSGQLHQTVNLASSEFGGSNPSLPTRSEDRKCQTQTSTEALAFQARSLRVQIPIARCGCSSAVELLPSKQDVVGSNPIARSGRSSAGRRITVRAGFPALRLSTSAAVAQW